MEVYFNFVDFSHYCWRGILGYWWVIKKEIKTPEAKLPEAKTLELKISAIDSQFKVKYFDDVWQFKKESPMGWYIDGQLIHRKLGKCEGWLGVDEHEICMPEEENCEAIKKENKKIKLLDDKAFIERTMWMVKKIKVNIF